MSSALFFVANDPGAIGTGTGELWEIGSDGTATQIQGIAHPNDLTFFNNALYLDSTDASGGTIWKVTADGTATEIANGTLFPDATIQGFTAYNNELYFSVNDGNGGFNLWKIAADGSVAQVYDLNLGPWSQVSNVDLPHDFVIYNNELYFVAEGRIGDSGSSSANPPVEMIWKVGTDGNVTQAVDIEAPHAPIVGMYLYGLSVVDGGLVFGANGIGVGSVYELYELTAQGDVVEVAGETKAPPISPISGFGDQPHSTFNQDPVALDDKLYFVGTDDPFGANVERVMIESGGSVTVTDLQPGTLAQFGVYNDAAYIIATQNGGSSMLWKIASDGTETAVGAMDQAQDYTVANNELYFVGRHGSTTDVWKVGADGQLTEITAVTDNIKVPGDLTVFNGELYFVAQVYGVFDGQFRDQVWKIDADGQVEQVTGAQPPLSDAQFTVADFNSSNMGHFGDFDNDGHDDVLWRNTDGTVATWQMNDDSITPHFLDGVSSDWSIAGIGDFNGDGHADIFWTNDSGPLLEWQMTSSAAFGATPDAGTDPGFAPGIGSSDSIAGVDDIDGDGKADILWRDDTTGAVTIWKMDGATTTATATVSGVGTDWAVVGTGDLNGDGKADILFRNTTDGVVAYWTWQNGANPLTDAPATTFLNGVPLDWHVVGMGDFDGNGTKDILWHNDNGANAVWLMGTDGLVQQAAFFDGVSADWHVAGTGDFDGRTSNGHPIDDVLWQSDTGATAIWTMNGAAIPTVSFPGGVPSEWSTQAHQYDYV